MRPLIGITIGDPAGIGPEIVVRSLANPDIYQQVRPLIIGSKKIVERALLVTNSQLIVQAVAAPADGTYRPGTVDVLDIDNVQPDAVPFGVISATAGQAAYDYIKTAIALALDKRIDGIATAPIQKEAIHQAGIPYIGHTEMFTGLTDSPKAVTMFHVNKMRIFFLSRHLSLLKACQYVTYENVLPFIENCVAAMKRLGLPNARLAVAALNPHGGEQGLCGDEEMTALSPAVKTAQEKGIRAMGPIPADSIFRLFDIDQCDAVLSLYHDQGHIAAKVHDLARTVSVTVGLPFVRTSVDHGTAFDIAGKGLASSKSMEESIRVTGLYVNLIQANGSDPV